MLLSIIIPTISFDERFYSTYESVIKLAYQDDVELVIVTSESPVQYAALNNMTRLSFVKDERKGIYPAMNCGIHAAKGKFIWFLNAGDIFILNERIFLDVLRSAQVDMIKFMALARHGYMPVERLSFFYLVRHSFNHQSFLTKKSFVIDHVFDERFSLASDYLFLLQFWSKNLTISYIDATLIKYDLSGATSSRSVVRTIRNERSAITKSLISQQKSLSWRFKFTSLHILQKALYTVVNSLDR